MATTLPDLGVSFNDRYVIKRVLGEGQRKRTYLAHDEMLQRDVALALVKPGAAQADPKATKREIERLGQAGPHAHIVSLHDAGVAVGIEYLVFDYMSGGDLEDHCRSLWDEGQQLTLDEVLSYGRQLCRALSHIHGKQLVHLDVSPRNVWLDEYGAAHLGDLDSAVWLGDPRTTDGGKSTTEAYVIPEIARGDPPDSRSDLFSLGALLYEISTGTRPLIASNHPTTERPPTDAPPSKIRRDLPTSFDSLVLQMLSVSLDERPSRAEDVMAALRAIATTSNVEAIIAAGESDRVEFKSTLSWATQVPRGVEQHSSKWRDEMRPKLEREVAGAIAAFLNTSGGTLLVGVADDGTVVGIEQDYHYLATERRNSDEWLRRFKDVVQKLLGREVWGNLQVSLVPGELGTVAVVTCSPRSLDTWLTDKNTEEFYIRGTSSTQLLKPRLAAQYIREHWPDLR